MTRDSNEAAPVENQPLFADVAFAIVPSNQLSDQERQRLEKTLTSQGAEHIPLYPSPGEPTDVRRYTHLISATTDFPEYQTALDSLVPVVRPSWVEACTSRDKLANPRPYSPDPRFFFSNIIISCADIPEGDKEAITGGVQAAGGQYSGPLSKVVTHLVALTLENDKCETSLRKNLKCKIVLPHWFDDCLKLGKKIDEGPYLLPDPEILSTDPGPLKLRENKDLYGASSPNAGALPTPVNSFMNGSERRNLTVFKSKKVMLSSDLNIGSRLQQIIEDLISGGEGKVVRKVSEADIYVCHYREGHDYMQASQTGLVIGNLVWLYHLITHNTWTSPTRRLLHYPVSRKGVPGFSGLRISLSNYTGEARVYLENLVKSTGAEYTKTMRQDNTHLITAHMMSEKCTAAKEWNINIVNHLWLEESYARCQIQTLTNPRYTHFPRRTNLGEVVGQTQLDVEAVKKIHGNSNNNNTIHPTSLYTNGTTRDIVHAQKPSPSQKAVSPSSLAPAQQRAGQGRSSVTKATTSTIRKPQSIDQDPMNTGHRNNDNKVLQTPVPQRFRNSNNNNDDNNDINGKENETPSTTSSRGAKARALSKLHDLAPDVALYEKEVKRVGGVIYGGRKVSDPDRVGSGERKVSDRSRKRSFDERDIGGDDGDHDDDDDNSEGVSEENATDEEQSRRKAKKPRAGGKQKVLQRIMLSGDQRWVDKQRKEVEEKAKLREIGIHITQNPNDATILCAPKIVRTKKFVCAIASAPTIVSTSYLDYCLKHDTTPSVKDHPLVDRTNEDLYGFRLADALERAKQNNHQLLSGWQIFCTEDVHGGFDTFREVVAINGGVCSLYKGRTGVVINKRANVQYSNGDDDSMDETVAAVDQNRSKDEGDTIYLISDPRTGDESTIWNKFRQMARKHDMRPRIVKPDWLLFVAMAQYVEWDEKWRLSGGDNIDE